MKLVSVYSMHVLCVLNNDLVYFAVTRANTTERSQLNSKPNKCIGSLYILVTFSLYCLCVNYIYQQYR